MNGYQIVWIFGIVFLILGIITHLIICWIASRWPDKIFGHDYEPDHD